MVQKGTDSQECKLLAQESTTKHRENREDRNKDDNPARHKGKTGTIYRGGNRCTTLDSNETSGRGQVKGINQSRRERGVAEGR